MNGQLKACHIGRRDMLARLGWDDITPEQGRLIKAVIVDQIRLLLTAEWRGGRGLGAATQRGSNWVSPRKA